ncbi:MAG: uroporphyrinogen-III synthase [Odoribacter sp.]|nr:uroporphyrinogen-III synthase [Odoribacter sp.]
MKVNKILVSQPKPSSEKSPYFELAQKHGVEIVFRPFIKVEGLTPREFRAQKIAIPEHTAIIFTAKTAIDHFFRLCEEMRITMPDTQKYFCTSETIANYLQKYIIYRKRKIFFPKTGKFADMLPQMVRHKDEKYLLAVSDVNSGTEAELLEKNKINYNRAVIYRTVSNDFGPDEPLDYQMLVFFSPQGIDSLGKNFPDFEQGDTAIATFGATTAKAARDAGLRVDIEAPAPNIPSMPAAIDQFLSAQKK